MWTVENRRRYDRSGLRYETDLTDDEWAEIAPMLPPAKPGGNKRSVNLREVVNGLMYILGTGCQWRAIPKDLAARSTVMTTSIAGTGTARSAHPLCALYQMPGGSVTRGQPNGSDHRCTEHQKRREGRRTHRSEWV